MVIGAITWPYEFWTLDGQLIDRGHFESDAEAECWVKEKYPQHYKNKIEVRVFDQS
jgi:hypothetical protein